MPSDPVLPAEAGIQDEGTPSHAAPAVLDSGGTAGPAAIRSPDSGFPPVRE